MTEEDVVFDEVEPGQVRLAEQGDKYRQQADDSAREEDRGVSEPALPGGP